MSESLSAAQSVCPKHMSNGPCGGVRPDSTCEVDAELACPYLGMLEELPWRGPRVLSERPPLRSQGRLEAALRAGEFAIVAEAYTTDSADLRSLISRYERMRPSITAVNIADHALATPHASAVAAAALFERGGIEAIVNMTCRDRNRIALQGDLLGAAALGIKNVFCVTGDHPELGDHPEARGVYDLDSFGLIQLARKLCDKGKLLNDRRLEIAPQLLVGCAVNPFTPPVALQAERVAAKVAAGADFIQTQAVFDVEAFAGFVKQLGTLGVLDRAWLIVGIAVVVSLEGAEWLRREVPGARVLESLFSSMSRTPGSRRRDTGLSYAAELVAQLREMPEVSGVLLFPLMDDVESIGELVELVA